MQYWPSRSSKIDDFHVICKGVCHFLLVINNNLGPVSRRFRDMARRQRSWDMISWWQNCTGKIHDDTGIIYELLIGCELSRGNFHVRIDTSWHAPPPSVGDKFAQCSRKWHEISAFQEFWTCQNFLHDMARNPAFFTHSSRSFAKSSRTGTLQCVPIREPNSCKCQLTKCSVTYEFLRYMIIQCWYPIPQRVGRLSWSWFRL